jgi:hypothetical protein
VSAAAGPKYLVQWLIISRRPIHFALVRKNHEDRSLPLATMAVADSGFHPHPAPAIGRNAAFHELAAGGSKEHLAVCASGGAMRRFLIADAAFRNFGGGRARACEQDWNAGGGSPNKVAA